MAKEILEKVTQTEAECEEIIAKAKNDARDRNESAHAEAEAIIKAAAENAQKEADKKLDDVKQGCDSIISEAESNAKKISLDLSFTADKNRENVIKSAVEKFF